MKWSQRTRRPCLSLLWRRRRCRLVVRTMRETVHSSSPTVLYVALGVTAASIVALAVGYARGNT